MWERLLFHKNILNTGIIISIYWLMQFEVVHLKLSNYRNLHVMMVWQVIITMYLLPLKEDSEPGSFWMSFLYTFKQAENQSCKKAHWIFLRHKSIYNDMIKCQAISFYTFLLLQWTSSYYMYSVTLEIVYWTSWSIMFNLYPNTKD